MSASSRHTSSDAHVPPTIHYGRMHHAGMLVADTQRAMRFYIDVLGMVDETAATRPNLPFKGAFLGCGGSQIHLMELPTVDPLTGRPEHGGRDKHVAITIANIDPLIASLERNNVAFTMSKSGRRAVFCRDLDGNALEFVEDPNVRV